MNASVDGLPLGLVWDTEPSSWHFDGEAWIFEAAGRTDHFVDPASAAAVLNGARAFVTPPDRPWQMSASITAALPATYDAGMLMLWSEEQHFAKLCFERSPLGPAMIVSVVTRGVSDDANGWVVDGDTVWLRISSIGDDAYAFHASSDGVFWELVRYFQLSGDGPMRCGISVQSPMGDGCTASFRGLALVENQLTELRDGT